MKVIINTETGKYLRDVNGSSVTWTCSLRGASFFLNETGARALWRKLRARRIPCEIVERSMSSEDFENEKRKYDAELLESIRRVMGEDSADIYAGLI